MLEVQRIKLDDFENGVRRLQDENGDFWYEYNDICNEFMIPDRERKFYDNRLPQTGSKVEFTYKDNLKTQTQRGEFIPTLILSMIIQQHCKNKLDKLRRLINLEHTTYFNERSKEFNDKLDELVPFIQNGDYVTTVNKIDELYKTEEFIDVLCDSNLKRKKETEMLAREIHGMMYDEYSEEMEIKIKDKVHTLTNENKGKNKIPNWIRDIK